MGWPGSGQWAQWSTKPTVEHYCYIDVRSGIARVAPSSRALHHLLAG